MPGLNVTFQRTPRALIVGDETITIELDHTLSGQDGGSENATHGQDDGGQQSAAHTIRQPETAGKNNAHKATSTASILTNPGDKLVVPFAQSSAVSVLSGADHDHSNAGAEFSVPSGPTEEELADLRQLLTNAADQAYDLKQMQRQSLDELQEVAVELATAAASFLAGYAIDKNIFAVDDLILKALNLLEADQPVRVRLNPADHQLLKELMNEPESAAILTEVSCVDDDSINRGGCRIESGRRVLVTDLHSRLEDIRRAWLEKLDDSQIERRGDGSASTTMRRFPDRRETA